jgi:hypothetical protein
MNAPGVLMVAMPPMATHWGFHDSKGHGGASGGAGAGFCSKAGVDGHEAHFLSVKAPQEVRHLRAEGRIFQVESHHKSHQRTAGLKRGTSDTKLLESCNSLQFSG